MWFLVRMAFWLSLVIVLLPTAPSQEQTSVSQVEATDVLSAASAAISDIRQFCVRQPGACATGSQAIVQFGHRAQTDAKLLYQFLDERMGVDQSALAAKGTDKSTQEPSSGTLTLADLAAPWHAPQPRAKTEGGPAHFFRIEIETEAVGHGAGT
jgi:hypothetical protein